MPTDPTTLAFALALAVPVAFVAGALVSRAVCRRRHRTELVQREVHMTAKLQERYVAYVELEEQVERIFGRLDELEAETARGLETTGVHIRELDELLAVCEGRSAPSHAAQEATGVELEPQVQAEAQVAEGGDALGWMDTLDDVLDVYCDDETLPGEEPVAQEQAEEPLTAEEAEDEPEPELGATALIAEWETKLETLREEKRHEIERQGNLIAELRERLKRLQEQGTQPRQAREQRAESTQERPQGEAERILGKELELWQTKYHTLERERTHDEAELLALREEAVELAEQVAALEPLREVREELTGRVAELESRLAERGEELARTRHDLAERNKELDSTRAELAARQEQLAVARRDLRASEERLAQAERRHAEAEAERRVEIEALECRIDELEPLVERVAELQAEVADCEQREVAARQRVAELEGDGRRLRGEIESLRGERKAATEMLHASKRALEEADERQHELEQRVAALSDRNETLSRELNDTRRNSEGQTTRISTLMAQLDEVRTDSEQLRRDAQIKGSMVEAAEGLLAELKPKLEALEARLHKRDEG